MAARTTRKAAAPKAAPAAEPTVEPSIDDIINAGEPLVEIVEEEPEAPAAVPATSQLEAPVAPERPDANGLSVPRAAEGGNFQVTDENVNAAGWAGPRREYVDGATRERIADVNAAFDRRQKHGGAYTCQVRIIERLWYADRNEPDARLVVAKGTVLNAAAVDHLVAHITAAHAEWDAA